MRLLNAKTLKLHEFIEGRTPNYVALSHTWRNEEVTYQEMLDPTKEVKSKLGYQKIAHCAGVCVAYRWDWLWVDTCCIDKSSSAELSEAINSMYAWYHNSIICYVYLDDYTFSKDELFESEESEVNQRAVNQLKKCRWFTRGWTLQELLAPRSACFFNSSWDLLGYKSDTESVKMSLLLSEITSIPASVILSSKSWTASDYSIAQKMSWASRRETTRREDIAYCLLGLFDVNMSLLYGEGDKVFFRLQEEIIKRTDDRSLFLWTDKDGDGDCYRGLLARHPSEFSSCGNIQSFSDVSNEAESIPYAMTNHRLEMQTALYKLSRQTLDLLGVQSSDLEESGLYLLPLGCSRGHEEYHRESLRIMLKRLHPARQQFARVQTHRLFEGPIDGDRGIETIYVRQNLRPSMEWTNVNLYGIQLCFQAQSSIQEYDRNRFFGEWKALYPAHESGILKSGIVFPSQSVKPGKLLLMLPITLYHSLNKEAIPFWFTIRNDSDFWRPGIHFNRRTLLDTERTASAIDENHTYMLRGEKDENGLSFEFYKAVLIEDRLVLQIGLFFNPEQLSILK